MTNIEIFMAFTLEILSVPYSSIFFTFVNWLDFLSLSARNILST